MKTPDLAELLWIFGGVVVAGLMSWTGLLELVKLHVPSRIRVAVGLLAVFVGVYLLVARRLAARREATQAASN